MRMLPSSAPGALPSEGTRPYCGADALPATSVIRAPDALWQFCIHFLRARRAGCARHGVILPQAVLEFAGAFPERGIAVEKGDERRDGQQLFRVDRHGKA